MNTPKVLSSEEIETALASLPGWSFGEDKLSKEFKFKDFVDSLNFINRMVGYFESMDHHPDVHIFYSTVKLELQRFDSGGKVTDRDVEVAGKIDQEYALQKTAL